MRQSNTSIQAYKSCRRMYQLKYIYGVEPTEKPEALERGTSYHQKVEQLLSGGTFDRDTDKTTAMADAFARHVLPHIKAVAQEEWFELPFADGEKIVGRIDARTEDGALVEHKTTSGDIDEQYWYGKQYDEQLMTYMLAYKTNRAIYTVCKVPTIRQKKGETEEEFLERCTAWYDEDPEHRIAWREIIIPQEQLDEWKVMLAETVGEIERCTLFYRNQTYCNRWGRMCEYAPICQHYDPNETYIGFQKKER